jgi:hypothetical protein
MLGWLALAAVCAPAEDFECAWENANRARDDASNGEVEENAPPPAKAEGALGAQWLWASGKAMPGVVFGGSYEALRFDLETSFVALTDPGREFASQFLGNQFGFHLMFRPVYAERWELAGGLGADLYTLWNIHGDALEVALSARVAGHFRLSNEVGVFVTARAYPLATSGLELGTARDRSAGLPVLFGTGVEWRFQ